MQRSLAMEMEARKKAAQMQISNFYRTGTWKINPETLYCIKEKHASREIHSLQVNGRNIIDPEETIWTTQEWYEITAQHTTLQTTSLQEFLVEHNITLPQVREDQKWILSDEYSPEENYDAIKEALEFLAPGPSGQNISFYKLFFMMGTHLMTEAINQMVFTPGLIN